MMLRVQHVHDMQILGGSATPPHDDHRLVLLMRELQYKGRTNAGGRSVTAKQRLKWSRRLRLVGTVVVLSSFVFSGAYFLWHDEANRDFRLATRIVLVGIILSTPFNLISIYLGRAAKVSPKKSADDP